MSNPTSNFGWQMPTNSDLVTDLPADFEVFGQAVDTSLADLKGGTTGQMLTKTSNTDMDFTWVTPQIGDITAITATSPLTGGGTSGDVTIGIQAASTSQSGAVQLTDSTSSTSTSTAATPNSVKSAYDLANTANTTANTANSTANAAIPKSLVDAKGDILTATADNTPARLAVGSTGFALVADSSASTGLNWSGNQAAAKNKFINGGFDIWQRGTSFTNPTVGGYVADRWMTNRSGDTAGATFSQSTDVPTGFQYAAKWQRTAGNTGNQAMALYYGMESNDSYVLQGQTVTLSCYIKKGANYSGTTVTMVIGTGTATDAKPYAYTTNAGNTTITPTTTWTRYSVTATLSSSLKQVFGSWDWTPSGTAGADDSIYITGVQMEISGSPTPFTRTGGTIQGELAACQRYYVRFNANSTNTYIGNGNAYSTSAAIPMVQMPVEMRVAPTSIDYAGIMITDDATNYSGGTVTLDRTAKLNVGIKYVHGSATLTAFRFYYLGLLIGSSGYLGINAEL